MPVTTSFVLSNADKSFEATAYLSRYTPYGWNEDLHCDKDMLSTDGIFLNPGGYFEPCPLFQVALIDEFLRENQIDLADPELYNKAHWSPHTGLYKAQRPVDRDCAEDGCVYRAQFRSINTNYHRLSISRKGPSQSPTRCSVLLLGMHLGRQFVPARMPPEPRRVTQLTRPTRSPAARGDSERPDFGTSALAFFV